MRKLIYVIFASILFIVGCKTDVTVEVYSSDLQRVATDRTAKLMVSTLMAIEIPSSKNCDEYTSQIVDIMKGLVRDFKPRECTTKGMESFLMLELQSPLMPSIDAWKAADRLFGVAISSEQRAVVVTLNRDKFAALNKRMNDEFHRTLNLAESKVTMILHNDERTPQTYGLGGALVNGQPIYERRYIEIEARRKATIQLSDVGSATLAKYGQVIVLKLKS